MNPVPTQRQLEFFITLAATTNFSRAAMNCGVSQPSFSNTIKNLEEVLGCRLFERNTRSVQITEIGAKLLPHAEAYLARWEHGINDLLNIAKNKSTVIRVAAVSTMTSDVLPKALARFKQGHPNIDVVVTDFISPEVEDAVHTGACDLGICLAPVDGERIESALVASDDLFVCCHRSHALARQARLSWDDVLDHQIVSLSGPSAIYNNIKMVYEQHAQKFKPFSTFRYQSSLMGMIANGDYFTILPSLMTQENSPSDIVTIPLENPIITRHYVLIRHKLEHHLPSHQELFDFLREELDRLCHIKKSMVHKSQLQTQ